MTKICYISEANEFGVSTHIIDLFKALLEKKDYEISFICGIDRLDNKMKQFLSQNEEIKVYFVTEMRRQLGFADVISFFKIAKILSRIKPDIVHCHSSKAGLYGRIGAKVTGVKKIIYSPHGYFFLNNTDSLSSKVYLLAEKILARFFGNYTITTSIGEKDSYINNSIDKIEKMVLIENGIEPIEPYDRDCNECPTIKTIGWMARMSDQKDPFTMVKIAKKLVNDDCNIRILVAGNGELYDEVSNQLENEVSTGKVCLLGVVSDPIKFLSNTDMFLTTSLYEGLPYTLLLCLAMGVPIIGTDVIGNKDCVLDGGNGYLFPAGDIDEGVNCIKKACNNLAFNKFGEESKRIYEERFTYKSMIQKYLNLYN